MTGQARRALPGKVVFFYIVPLYPFLKGGACGALAGQKGGLMGFSEWIDSINSFARNNTIIAIVVALALLVFIYRKPKLFFFLLFIGLFLAAVFWMISSIAGPGASQKKKMIQQEEKQSRQYPLIVPRAGSPYSRATS
jgi:hypothetical protein